MRKPLAILADVSFSMADCARGVPQSKHALLRAALVTTFARRADWHLVAFNDSAKVCDVTTLPDPENGTRVCAALQVVLPFACDELLLISDGLPNPEHPAESLAMLDLAFPWVKVSALFIRSRDSFVNDDALFYLRRVVRNGGGIYDTDSRLLEGITYLLGGPLP